MHNRSFNVYLYFSCYYGFAGLAFYFTLGAFVELVNRQLSSVIDVLIGRTSVPPLTTFTVDFFTNKETCLNSMKFPSLSIFIPPSA